ncbi:MAG: cren protein [Candidatus Nezhaarchaeota archaeon]|nr:cren protein [Candidatus Nezhaarchaeota archaeon]
MKTTETKYVKPIEVRSLSDLARFAASIATLGQPVYVVHFKDGERHVYGVFAVYHDYYDLYGIPLFYYYSCDEELDGTYILIKAEESRESVQVSYGARPGWVAIPIVNLKAKPPFI